MKNLAYRIQTFHRIDTSFPKTPGLEFAGLQTGISGEQAFRILPHLNQAMPYYSFNGNNIFKL